jgi:hypothetical protein
MRPSGVRRGGSIMGPHGSASAVIVWCKTLTSCQLNCEQILQVRRLLVPQLSQDMGRFSRTRVLGCMSMSSRVSDLSMSSGVLDRDRDSMNWGPNLVSLLWEHPEPRLSGNDNGSSKRI